ncbi:MAG: hypothetical protein AAB642_03265 [Patescibacteria group bacterium]
MPKYDPKGKKCQDTVRLKYEGEDYAVIARDLKIPIDTLKKWFADGGLLFESYKEYRDAQNQFREDEALEVLRREIKTASRMLIGLMASTSDGVKLRAVLAILERLLGKPTQPIRHEGNLGLTELTYEQQLREIRKNYGDNTKQNQ